MKSRLTLLLALTCLSASQLAMAQAALTLPAASAPTAVPPLIRYSGIAIDADSRPLAGQVSIAFLVFEEMEGGSPLWSESQLLQLDAAGRYQVQLGAASPNGLPPGLFATGEARWLEIQVAGETPQPRILLASVPYALKAADAATLGGLPASAYALAATTVAASAITASTQTAGVSPDTTTNVTTTGGTSGYLPLFTGAAAITDSLVFQNTLGIGIGDVPNGALDVNGKSIFRGPLQVARIGNATTAAGVNSNPFAFFAQAYNSSTKANVGPYFELQAEPTGNNTATPGATLHLLYDNGSETTPPETGLSINANGTIHFATGQAFATTGQLTSTVATGTAPLVVSSTTVVPNLNASLLDGVAAGAFAALAASNNFAAEQTFSKVGIGTATPRSALEISTSAARALGPVLTLTNTAGGTGAQDALDFNTTAPSTTGAYNPMARIAAQDALRYSDNLVFQSNIPGAQNDGLQTNMIVQSNGQVGIGTAAPGAQFEVDASAALGTDSLYTYGATTTAGVGTLGLQSQGGNGLSAGAGGNGGSFLGGYAEGTGAGGDGIYASAGGAAAAGAAQGDAGYFSGNVVITGTTSGAVAQMEIDHPLDPANQYLAHASVQSSEMVNIYSGNVTTDELGIATVQLPAWFEAENTDFRYQLTVLGKFAQAIISQEIANHQFKISTSATFTKVSWQVTGVRQDAYAKAHPLIVEREKPASERGFYTHPELYGQPAARQTQYARHPEAMRHAAAARIPQKSVVSQAANPPLSHP